MLILIILLLICLAGSFFFSGSETGFFTWNRLKVAHAAGQGDVTARMGMLLINNRGRLLATVLVGNNVVNVLSTLIFAELYLRVDAAVTFDMTRIPSPESWFLTPAVLLFCEILPKSLYRTYPFILTMKSVPLLTVFYFVMSPLFWTVGRAAKLAGFGRGSDDAPQSADVREEILLVVTEGAKRGNIFESAHTLVRNTLGMKGADVDAFAHTLDEWKRLRPVYRASQMLSEFGAGIGIDDAEVVVFDDALTAPIGYVPLLDAAGQSAALKTFGTLVKPLPRVRSGMEALACLRKMTRDAPRYYAVVSGGEVTALLDKMEIYAAAFKKTGAAAA